MSISLMNDYWMKFCWALLKIWIITSIINDIIGVIDCLILTTVIFYYYNYFSVCVVGEGPKISPFENPLTQSNLLLFDRGTRMTNIATTKFITNEEVAEENLCIRDIPTQQLMCGNADFKEKLLYITWSTPLLLLCIILA